MKFNKAQQQFIDIAKEPIPDFSLELISVMDWGLGVTTALKHIQKNLNKEGTQHCWLQGRSQHEISIGLMRYTGRDFYGYGTTDRLTIALKKLHDGKRPVCLWIDEARMMRHIEREDLVIRCENIAKHEGIPIRVVLIVGKKGVWDNERQEKVNRVEHPQRLLERVERGCARQFTFSRKGMIEAETESTQTNNVFAVKTA